MRMGGIKDDLFNGRRRKLKVAYVLTGERLPAEDVELTIPADEVTIQTKQPPAAPTEPPAAPSVRVDVPHDDVSVYKPRMRR